MGQSEGALDFKTVIEQVKALATEDHEHKTLIIDSISKLFNSEVAREAERLGEKNGFGADKKPAIANMRQLVSWLNRLDMTVILIAHEKALWGVDSKGDRSEIGVTFDGWDKLEYELHLCLNVVKRGDLRQAIVRKSRLKEFPDASFFPWSFEDFSSKYGKEIIQKKAAQVVLAKAEDVGEVVRLLEVVKVAPEDLEKWLTKAGVTSFEEMTDEQIQKIINFLKGKLK
jgi:hypothetical protein